MDAALLTTRAFWDDTSPVKAGDRELVGHVLFETSGSTGSPKWIALSKEALGISARAVNAHLGVTADSCWGLALPTHHVGGFGVAARAYQAGCRMAVFHGKWNPEEFQKWLDAERVTHTSLVPTQVHDLVREKLPSPPSLVAIVVGGGHLEMATGQAARDLGWPVLASYGMTEACSQIATQGLDQLDLPYASAPIPLLPIWQARVSEDQRIAISGPALFSGMLCGGIYRPRIEDWYLTADLVSMDGRSLTPLGRADNQVKVLGELVDLAMIESELLGLSLGRIASGSLAVVAVPDERAGHVLVPVFEGDVDAAEIEATLRVYQETVPGFRRLGPAVVVDRFPRSELGKLRRQELIALSLAGHDQERVKENH